MTSQLHSILLAWLMRLSWYQYVGEFIALILFFASLTLKVNDKEKGKVWRNFLRSSSFLIAFSLITIPWLIKGIF